MPAASNVERVNAESGGGDQQQHHNSKIMQANNAAQDPSKIVNTIIEKKIRNLEKRKVNTMKKFFKIISNLFFFRIKRLVCSKLKLWMRIMLKKDNYKKINLMP